MEFHEQFVVQQQLTLPGLAVDGHDLGEPLAGKASRPLSWLLVRPRQDRLGIRGAQDLKSGHVVVKICLMLRTVAHRIRFAIVHSASRAASVIRSATRPVSLVAGLLGDLVRSRPELIAENTLLRQQLIVAARHVKRPAFRAHERALLVLLARLVRHWPHAVLLVRPETIPRWHRDGFRLFWRWRSRARQAREPRVSAEAIALIRRMAHENRLWGAERIRGELLKLGVRLAKRTVQRYMRGSRPSTPSDGQRWRTFLRNHSVWACDFLQTYDIWFRPIFAFFIIDVNTKRVVHIAVTRAPTQQWTAQQLLQCNALRARTEVSHSRSRRQVRRGLRSRRHGCRDSHSAHGGADAPDELGLRTLSGQRPARVSRPPDCPR